MTEMIPTVNQVLQKYSTPLVNFPESHFRYIVLCCTAFNIFLEKFIVNSITFVASWTSLALIARYGIQTSTLEARIVNSTLKTEQ